MKLTPEVIDALWAEYPSDYYRFAQAVIDAEKAQQPAVQMDASDTKFLSLRLGRVAKLVGVQMPDQSHDHIAGVAGVILGDIARALEKRRTVDDLIDRLTTVSSAIADQDDRAAQAILRETIAMLNAAPEAPAVQRESKAETALNKVLNVIQRYLPPDGPTINDAMSEIIGIVDPWPLDTQPEAPAAQKEQS